MPTHSGPQDRPVILITGFGPFPTVAANATSILVPRIAETARQAIPGVAIAAHILPTEWETSLSLVHVLTQRLRPAVALHFGVSGRATGFEIETRGRNRCCLSEDAAGRLPTDVCLSAGGPEFLPATLPAAHIVMRLRQRGLPAQISRDAGGYLCNALLYRSLEIARRSNAPTRTGFVHLPTSLINERRPACEPRISGRLTWDDVVDGSLEILLATLGRRSGRPRNGGGFGVMMKRRVHAGLRSTIVET
ncbi:MAG: pyroglutamyl-peptidase I [Hyphomicrobiaceae bacterium]